ncbi:MAG: GNAT family N-acetyltransferase, partial [Acidimicrobiia bacterium]|nr:GNAT family N-acetyltransferase [Acidimicrobiia bacterium]
SSTLRADGRLISVWLGFVHDDVWSGWIFAYDPDPAIRKYSAGKQLLHSMLEESHRLGHREFDFSIGDEDYKWFFATHARVLGPVGQPPISERVRTSAREAKRFTKQVLARHPKLLDGAASLGGAVRKQRCRLAERVARRQ